MHSASHRRAARGAAFALPVSAVGLALAGVAPEALAQQANLTPAATQPAVGRLTLNTQYRFTRHEGQGREVDVHEAITSLTLGLAPTVSASLTVPVMAEVDRSGGPGDEDAAGAGDLRLALKWRFWQYDPGGLDTTRAAVFGGVELPTGTGELSSHSTDPFLGVVYMIVRGRHGFNQSASYQVNTGDREGRVQAGANGDDLVEVRSAYLYRLAPEAYAADTEGSWYATVELEGFYETNGDTEVLLSPGLLYEGRRWAGELGVRLPVAEDVDHRPGVEWGMYAGVRVLF